MLNRLIRGVGALVVLVALLVGAPLALLAWVGNPWPTGGWSEVQLLTNRTIIGALAVVGWLAWAQMAACILIELAGAVRGKAPQRVRFAAGGQQQFARVLVTSVIALGIGASTVGPSLAATTVATPQPETAPTSHTIERRDIQPGQVNAGPAVTIDRATTVWKLAETHLDDGSRWRELLDLNRGGALSDGTTLTQATQTIPAGTTLRLPAGAHVDAPADLAVADRDQRDRKEGSYTVKPNDTLWDIAETKLDDPIRYMELYEANADVIGSNPDLIYPGQVLVLPGAHNPTTDREQEPKQHDHGPDDATDGQEAPAEPAIPTAPPQETVQDSPSTEQVAGDEVDAASDEGGITGLRALLATAACLAVGALGLVAGNRRRQFRRRRIGRTIASTPDELVEVEQAILEHGSEAQEDVAFLDRALRHVAASCKVAGHPLPQLGAAVLGDEDLTLLFTDPAPGEVPQGWTATDDARAWMLPRWTFLEEDLENQPAPYPALVTIGQDEGGRTWLLDLETLGMCGIGGDPAQVADLARFMVAELAVNAWSEGSEVLLADQFGTETIGLNPARLRPVQRSDALARAAVLTGEMGEGEQNLDADVLTRRRDGLLLDSTNPVVVVVSSRPEGEFVADIEDRDRSRVVVVHGDEETPAVKLAGDGMALLPMWGISVKAFTLPTAEAEAMAALVASTRNLEDEPVPATQSDDGPLGKYARADGSLREEYTEPRRTEGNDPSSMLPDADEVYLATAATTTEDLASAAPSVPEEVRAEIAALDPTLDQDVADWFDESSPRPKVHLLGPVSVTALNGGDPAAIDNAGGTVSFIAYLAVQDQGVTGERAAVACGWKTQKTVQNRATNARFLLGTRPDGSDWLPDASMSAGARRGASPTYELVREPGGVLTSPDLFVRLKHRAERRGDNGCEEDLVTALSLVTGAPFEAATESRFKWLFKPGQQRWDEILVGAIHDAAHILATRAVTAGRTDLVRVACDAARKASTHSDIAWLDEAAATEAESGRDAAGELIREQVLDRYDEDLPPRSEAVVEQREWGATG